MPLKVQQTRNPGKASNGIRDNCKLLNGLFDKLLFNIKFLKNLKNYNQQHLVCMGDALVSLWMQALVCGSSIYFTLMFMFAGDVLVFVNGTCVLGFTHHDMVTMFQNINPGEVTDNVITDHYSKLFFYLLDHWEGGGGRNFPNY